MKKAVTLCGLILLLMLIVSPLASVASAEDIIIDTEKGETRFWTEPARDLPANWQYVHDHPDTSSDGWFDTYAYPPGQGNGSFWYTISFPEMSECKGIWLASLPHSAVYEVFAWIPDPDPFDPYLDESTPPSDYLPTKRAQYKVFHNGGVAAVTIDQNVNRGGFTSLGVFEFDSTTRVELSNNGVEFWRCVAFDAVKFVAVAKHLTISEGASSIIVHVCNPEGIEIASIEGLGPFSVEIYDGNTLIGYGAHSDETCNKPIPISSGVHTIKAKFNGITREQTIYLNSNERKILTFRFGREIFDLTSYVYDCDLSSHISGSWDGATEGERDKKQHTHTDWGTEVYFKEPVDCGRYGTYEGEAKLQFSLVGVNYNWYAYARYNLHAYCGEEEGCDCSPQTPYWHADTFEDSNSYSIASQHEDFDYWYLQPDTITGDVEFYVGDNLLASENTYLIPTVDDSSLRIVIGEHFHVWGGAPETREDGGSGTFGVNMSSVPYDLTGTGIRCVTIIIDAKNSESWIDPHSSDEDDKEAVIWYEIEPEEFSGELYMEVRDSEGNDYTWDEGFISTSGGRGSVTWNGKVNGESVDQSKNPYNVTLVVEDEGKEVARSNEHKIWVGRPVLLLHGIFSSKEGMEKTELFKKLGKSFYVRSIEYDGGIIGSATGDIKQYAGVLSHTISVIKEKTGASKVDIVSHSMGGLVSRWCIQKRHSNDVGKLIMIGPPNHGSDWAKAPSAILKLTIKKLLPGIPFTDDLIDMLLSGTALHQMIPHSPFLQELNGNNMCAYYIERDGDPDRISNGYVVIPTGDIPTYSHAHIFGFEVPSGTAGDFIVPYASAKLSTVTDWPVCGWSNWHCAQTGSSDVINKVEYLLKLSDEQYEQFSKAQTSKVYQTQQELNFTTVPVYWTYPIDDIVYPGEVKTYNITVDSSSTEVQFLLIWDEGDINVSLFAPNETVIDIYTEDCYAFYTVQNPDSGNWTVKVAPLEIPPDGVNLTLQAFLKNPLFVGVTTNKTIFDPGEAINISAYVGSNESAFTGAIVVAKIFKPDNTTENITLYDDGLHNDNQTNDGIYANIYTNTSSWGTYYITVSATGTFDGEDFEREAFTTVWVKLYPDLTLTSSDISFSNGAPIAGENTTINATIHNIGDTDATNASILFYDGEPASGEKIREDTINVSVGQTATVSTSWNATSGHHEIYVLISPFNEFLESNYTNNNASKTINVRDMTTLYYPDFTDTDTPGNWRTWIGVMNTGDASTTLNLMIYNQDGSLAYSNPNFVTLEPKAAHFFRPGITAGIAQGSTIVYGDNLAGTCHESKNDGDGAKVYTAVTSSSPTLYYPDFTDTDTIGNWRTWLGVVNAGDTSTTVRLDVYNPDGSLAYSNANFVTLEPKAAHFFRPGITAGIAQGCVVVSGANLAGTCHVNKNGGEGTKVYTALSSGSSTLNYPDFTDTDTSGNWRTWMGVMNTGDTSTTLNLTIYNPDGSLAYSNANFITLEPKAAHFFRPGITAGIAQGDVVVYGDNLAGTCHVNKNGGVSTKVYTALSSGSSTLNYPDFTDTDTAGNWRTWMGVMNTGATRTTVRLDVYNADGSLAYSNANFVTLEPKAAHFFRPGITAGIAQGDVVVSGDNLAGTCHVNKNGGVGTKVYTAVGG